MNSRCKTREPKRGRRFGDHLVLMKCRTSNPTSPLSNLNPASPWQLPMSRMPELPWAIYASASLLQQKGSLVWFGFFPESSSKSASLQVKAIIAFLPAHHGKGGQLFSLFLIAAFQLFHRRMQNQGWKGPWEETPKPNFQLKPGLFLTKPCQSKCLSNLLLKMQSKGDTTSFLGCPVKSLTSLRVIKFFLISNLYFLDCNLTLLLHVLFPANHLSLPHHVTTFQGFKDCYQMPTQSSCLQSKYPSTSKTGGVQEVDRHWVRDDADIAIPMLCYGILSSCCTFLVAI